MNKTGRIIAAIVGVGLIAGGVFWFTNKPTAQTNTTQTNESDTASTLTITYTAENGFSPASNTIKAGEKVTFTNNSQTAIQPASDPHPAHTTNSELNIGNLEPGASKTITLSAKGTWSIHNHLDHTKSATITVE